MSKSWLSSEGWLPGKFVSSPSTPSFGWSQEQSFLKKTLVMATARANSTRLAHQLSPAVREEKGEELEVEGRWDLARGQTSTPLLRWSDRNLWLLPGSS